METIGYLRNCVFVVHVRVKVCISIHVQHVRMHVEARGQRVLSLGCDLLYFETGLSMAWSSRIKLGCLASKSQGLSSVTSSVVYKCVPVFFLFLFFKCGCWD